MYPPTFTQLLRKNPVFKLVIQMITGLVLFSILVTATMGIGEVKHWVEGYGVTSPRILSAFDLMEDFLFISDGFCLIVFVVTEVVHFVRSMINSARGL